MLPGGEAVRPARSAAARCVPSFASRCAVGVSGRHHGARSTVGGRRSSRLLDGQSTRVSNGAALPTEAQIRPPTRRHLFFA